LTVGAIVTTFLSGLLLGRELVSIRNMLLITACMPLITFTLSFFVNERRIEDRSELKVHEAIKPKFIYGAIVALILTVIMLWPNPATNSGLMSLGIIALWFIWFAWYFKHLMDMKLIGKSILAAAVFIFLWRFTPSFGAPWQDYFLNKVRIDEETFGYFGVVSYLGWLVGTLIFNRWLDKLNLKKVLFWTIVISTVLGMSQLTLTHLDLANSVGQNLIIRGFGSLFALPVYLIAHGSAAWDYLSVYDGIVYLDFFLDFLLGILYMTSYLSLLKFVALSTPKNLEGTNFAVMASIMNFGLVFGYVSGGWLYSHIENGMWGMNGLQITVWLGAITSLMALIAMPWIKTEHLPHD
jgi:hypothetical protein